MVKVDLDVETWGLICDAIEIAIGDLPDDDPPPNKKRFWHMEDIMRETVEEIEKQSGCQTKDD